MSFFRRAGALIARFFESPVDPAAVANEFKLYAKDDAGVSQLFGRSDDGTVHQITPAATGVGGSGTADFVARWTPDGNTLGDSVIQDNGGALLSGETTEEVRWTAQSTGNTSRVLIDARPDEVGIKIETDNADTSVGTVPGIEIASTGAGYIRIFQTGTAGIAMGTTGSGQTIGLQTAPDGVVHLQPLGFGTVVVGNGTTSAAPGEVWFQVSKTADHSFIEVDTIGAGKDAGVIFATLTSPEDAAIFLDESDGRILKFAMGDVGSDANRNANTKMRISQTGKLAIGDGFSIAYPLDVRYSAPHSLVGWVNTDNTGNSAVDVYNHLTQHQGSIGFANAASATAAWVQGLLYSYSTGPDWVWANSTRNAHRFGMTNGSVFYQLADGGTGPAPVSEVGTCRLMWNQGTGKLQISKSGAAYIDVI